MNFADTTLWFYDSVLKCFFVNNNHHTYQHYNIIAKKVVTHKMKTIRLVPLSRSTTANFSLPLSKIFLVLISFAHTTKENVMLRSWCVPTLYLASSTMHNPELKQYKIDNESLETNTGVNLFYYSKKIFLWNICARVVWFVVYN